MPDQIDSEIAAIGSVLKALEPLDTTARRSVLDYVVRRLALPSQTTGGLAAPGGANAPLGERSIVEESAKEVHLKDLVTNKQPRSANEMAALVAYYLSHRAPQNERKQTITTKEIETYFKIGGFRLPSKPQFTLANAKQAGYLDAAGGGEYKLNPVGYNLVVHSMPKSAEHKTQQKKRTPKKSQKTKR